MRRSVGHAARPDRLAGRAGAGPDPLWPLFRPSGRPRFASFSEAIGKAGLAAEKTDYAWLIRLYWFTIEFGLIREGGVIKGLGSGLASSVAELEWATSDKPEIRPFDVLDILRTPYRIDILQPVYFVIEDLDQLFSAAGRDLLADVAQARRLGLHAPKYPAKVA